MLSRRSMDPRTLLGRVEDRSYCVCVTAVRAEATGRASQQAQEGTPEGALRPAPVVRAGRSFPPDRRGSRRLRLALSGAPPKRAHHFSTYTFPSSPRSFERIGPSNSRTVWFLSSEHSRSPARVALFDLTKDHATHGHREDRAVRDGA